MSARVFPAAPLDGAAADRWLAGGTSAALGVGVVAALAGALSGSLALAAMGGAVAGAALIVLMAPRWLEPTVLVALAVPLPAIWSGDGLRVAGAAPVAAAAVAAWVLHRATATSGVRFGALPLRTLGALALLLVLTTAASPHLGVALRKLANLAVLGVLLFALTDLMAESPALRARVATVLALLGAICGGLAVLETLGVIPGAFPAWGTPYSRAALGFGQPNGLGFYLAVVLPLVVWRAETSSGLRRLAWGAALLATAAGLLGTFSRGTWGAVVLGGIALVAAGAWGRSLRLVGSVLVAALLLDLGTGGLIRDRIASSVGDWAVEQRAALMIAGILMFVERPLLGFGPGGFEPELDRFGIQVPELWDFQATPHNAYVQMAAETGIFGLILYVTLLWAFLRVAARAVRRAGSERDGALDRALLWCIGVVIASGLSFWPYALDTGQAVILVFALVASSPSLAAAGSSAPAHAAAAPAPRLAAAPLP